MVRFSYQKLYADLVTADGSVCIVYVARLGIAAFQQRSAGYELYTGDGRRTVVHATGPADVEVCPELIRIAFPTRAERFELVCRSTRVEPSVDHAPTRGLRWRVVIHQGSSEVRIVSPGREPRVLKGSGYVDEVVLERPPRTLGLRRIRWGRAHFGDASLVFNEVLLRSGQTWRATSDGTTWSSELELFDTPGLTAVRHGGTRFEFHTVRSLHEGAAIDEARFPGRPWRDMARLMSGRIEERRCLSSVEDDRGIEGVSLHEDVRFG